MLKSEHNLNQDNGDDITCVFYLKDSKDIIQGCLYRLNRIPHNEHEHILNLNLIFICNEGISL